MHKRVRTSSGMGREARWKMPLVNVGFGTVNLRLI
jgi:hypothetical protein